MTVLWRRVAHCGCGCLSDEATPNGRFFREKWLLYLVDAILCWCRTWGYDGILGSLAVFILRRISAHTDVFRVGG